MSVSRVLAALVGGYLAGRLVWLSLRPTFRQPAFQAENYRGTSLPTGAGLVITVTLAMIEGVRALVVPAGPGGRPSDLAQRALLVLVAAGFALVGIFDDFASRNTDALNSDESRGRSEGAGASGPDRTAVVSDHQETVSPELGGFSGHWRAARRGRLTSGGLKLLVGAAIALIAVAPLGGGLLSLVRDSALVALCANLANLCDRAPGRTLKVSAVAFLLLAPLATRPGILVEVALVVGAGLALFLDDLRERLMLGDAGANVLGAVLGLGVVMSCGPATRTSVLIVVAGLNLASELTSFSRVIEAVPPLRALDRWGRRR